jgi:hypothetical protein
VIRVRLPQQLRVLARVEGEVTVRVDGVVSIASILDGLEADYPVLCGAIRDKRTGVRRPMVRFFACEQDISNDPTDQPLPAAVAEGRESLMIIGALSGG